MADTFNHRIQYFTATGSFLGKWGTEGSRSGEFEFPTDVTVSPGGYVFAADFLNDRIQYFTAVGSFLGKFGKSGVGKGEFRYPSGVAVTPLINRVYVADSTINRIQYLKQANPAIAPASLGRVKALFR